MQLDEATEDTPSPLNPGQLNTLLLPALSAYLDPQHPSTVRLAALKEIHSRLSQPAVGSADSLPSTAGMQAATLQALAAQPAGITNLVELLSDPDSGLQEETVAVLHEVCQDEAVTKLLVAQPSGGTLVDHITQFLQTREGKVRGGCPLQELATSIVYSLSTGPLAAASAAAAGLPLLKALHDVLAAATAWATPLAGLYAAGALEAIFTNNPGVVAYVAYEPWDKDNNDQPPASWQQLPPQTLERRECCWYVVNELRCKLRLELMVRVAANTLAALVHNHTANK